MNTQTRHPQRSISHTGMSRMAHGALVLLAGAALLGAGTAQAEGEGIQVHGDWVLTIHEADGTLVREMEFENALTPQGGDRLGSILAGARNFDPDVPSNFEIQATGENIVIGGFCTRDYLQPFDPDNALSRPVEGQGATFTRTFAVPEECIDGGSWELTGVISVILFESNGGNGGVDFTSKTLDTPVTVLPDQLVTLKVTFSFE